MTYKYIEENFVNHFGERENLRIYSAPGRVELCGNHTDHQGGRVLAAAIKQKAYAAASKRNDGKIRVFCEEYGEYELSLSDLGFRESEKNTTISLLRGIANGLNERGVLLCGADIYIKSDVPKGSGLSSSAAFEVLIATVFSDLSGSFLNPYDIAKTGQEAESKYFGKPCGLMDQMASALGGIVSIDFSKTPPEHRKIECDFEKYGYNLVVINAGAGHENLTDEYAAIPKEMGEVAKCFGKDRLSEISEKSFYESINEIRKNMGDRAVLRAIHYFNEDRRAKVAAKNIETGDFESFLKTIKESGDSSFKYLQNIYPAGAKQNQELAVLQVLCEKELASCGAVRIQGGGFGGTVEAFVQIEMTDEFIRHIEKVFGKGSCKCLSVSQCGGKRER